MAEATKPAAPEAKAKAAPPSARYSARLRFARISARKMRYVVDLVRGKDYNSALSILRVCAKRGAPFCKKLLESAAANAVHQAEDKQRDLDANNLVLVEARVDGGPMMKRFRPASVRRPTMIKKRFCHVTFVLEERPPRESKAERSKRVRQERAKAARKEQQAAKAAAAAKETPSEPPKDAGPAAAPPAAGK